MTPSDAPSPAPAEVPHRLILLIAIACGLIVANLYYAQPLIGPISASLGLPPEQAGFIVTLTQIGYGLGLLFIVPLGDLIENKTLVLTVMAAGVLALLGAAFAVSPLAFLMASLFIGIGSVSVQILLPFASHLAPEAVRGRVVGTVMGGLMTGIMLARPAASLITGLASWRAVFIFGTIVMIVVAVLLKVAMPRRRPGTTLGYFDLLRSMRTLAVETPVLRRRAAYQCCLFAAFSLFWTSAPLLLASPQFGFSQFGIALFGLAGASGAIAAPIIGRLADRGLSRRATVLAMGIVAASFVVGVIDRSGSTLSVLGLVLAAVLLDFGVQANTVLGARALYMLAPEHRSRLNGLYIASFFLAGAAGAALGAWTFAAGGWLFTSAAGFVLPLIAIAYSATEPNET